MTTTNEFRPHLPSSGRRTPVSTYRLQLGPDLSFKQAQEQLPYLASLGVTDLYLSPILQAAPGSTHGYDVVDHSKISEVMGGRKGFEKLATAAHEAGFGVVVDVVPNHMAVPTPIYHNRALWSVLKDGPNSPFSTWFDGSDNMGDEGILMPVLGARIGTVLANNEITLERRVIPGLDDQGEQPVLVYYDHVFPVRGGTESLPLPLCIKAQYYRLAYWKVADEELNFRRFFDVDTLVAIRVEEEEVFNATHALLLDLYKNGHIDAFRIDHPDGLADPRGYMRRLSAATGGAWIAAEKILEGDEPMPDDWPVAGTTGYDAAWRIHSLHCDPAGAADTATLALQITGDIPGSLPSVIEQSKREITTTSLFAEVYRIANLVNEICSQDIMLRDHTFRWIRTCVAELVVAFERYRAYIVPGEDADVEALEVIEDAAKRARARLDPELHDTLEVVIDLVLGREVGVEGHSQRDRRDELVVRFQQVCGAVQAKGVEDTAYYRWTQMVSLNEVGGSPAVWGISPDHFHTWASATAERWPVTMTCGTTHDTKRSEDVRNQIGVLSQFGAEWRELVTELHPLMDGVEGHTENLMWQILAGTWTDDGPIEVDRLTAYALKASREQKLWTSWTNQDADGEQHLVDTLTNLCSDPVVLERFSAWHTLTADAVRTSVLSRKTVQLTCLGVADTYQGCETLQNYLVDPDNRRPVDYKELAKQLRAVKRRAPKNLAEEKLFLTNKLLELRRRRPDAFVGPEAAYKPLPTSTGYVLAYSRGTKPDVVVLASRLHRAFTDLPGFTEHTVVVPKGNWTDVLTGATTKGGEIPLSKRLSPYPVAVLERTDA